MPKKILLLAALAALVLPATAGAHVTLQPSEATTGGFTVLNVRVPNERDDAGTVKVEVQFPDGFATASYEPVPGWDVEVTREQAPKPIDMHGEQVTEQIDTVTFSGGKIGPGQFTDFPLSVRIPDGEAGTKLTFKALQTYEGGEVVRWIGPEDADAPAPTVTLLAAEEGHGAAPTSAVSEEDGGGSDAIAYVALALGLLGAGLGAAAFARSRPAARRGAAQREAEAA
jgi:uncharacterized protein